MKLPAEKRARIGILVKGGLCPGINTVIYAVTRCAVRLGVEVIGLSEGFRWLADRDTTHHRRLTLDDVRPVRWRGGSLLSSSRHNPADDESQMANVTKALRELGIGHLVTIGGDDTLAVAAALARIGSLKVVSVPKTIDNDLPLGEAPTFGFWSAADLGGALVRSLYKDAEATQRLYVVVTMGRSTGHLPLAIGTAGGASCTIIPEEFANRKVSLELLCRIIEGCYFKSCVMGMGHALAVVGEGVAELMEQELKNHNLVQVERDAHGHLQLGGVPLALILRRLLQARAKQRKQELGCVDYTLGYELRCADPNAYDIAYCDQLGRAAAQHLLEKGDDDRPRTATLMMIQEGKGVPVPFEELIDSTTGRAPLRRVDLNSDAYQCARSGMIRLEPEDLEGERARHIGVAAGISTDHLYSEYWPIAEQIKQA